jgi:hypothetical protein
LESGHHRCSDPAGSTVEFTGRYQSIPDTFVQLFVFQTSGLIVYRDPQQATRKFQGVSMNDLKKMLDTANAQAQAGKMKGECHD